MEDKRIYVLCLFCCLATIVLSDSVTTPPKLDVQPRKEWAYKEGEPIRLPCEASGTPPIEYQWQKNLMPVEIDGLYVRQEAGTGTLVITPPTTEDEEEDIDGVYQCFANNQFGTAVSVRSMVKKAYIKTFHTLPEAKKLFPLVGTYLNLTCHPPESYPKALVYWTSGTGEDFQNVPLSKRVALDYEGNLHIANVMMEDKNKYTCNAKNDYLRVTSEGDDTILTPEPIGKRTVHEPLTEIPHAPIQMLLLFIVHVHVGPLNAHSSSPS